MTTIDNTTYLLIVDCGKGLRNLNTLGCSATRVAITSPTAPKCVELSTRRVENKNPSYNQCGILSLPENVTHLLKLCTLSGDGDTITGESSIDIRKECAKDPGEWVTCELMLGGNKATGSLIIKVMEYHHDPMLTITSCSNLKNADKKVFGKADLSDPYVKLTGLMNLTMEHGRTEVVPDHLYPKFKQNVFTIQVKALTPAGCMLLPLKAEVCDEDKGKKDDPLGHIVIGWTDLFRGLKETDLELKQYKLEGPGSLGHPSNSIDLIIGKAEMSSTLPPPPPVDATEEAAEEPTTGERETPAVEPVISAENTDNSSPTTEVVDGESTFETTSA